jgi:hypothetical protein
LQKYIRRWGALQFTCRLRRYQQTDSNRRRACMRWVQAVRSRINTRKHGQRRCVLLWHRQ